jgi:hypothetical protein
MDIVPKGLSTTLHTHTHASWGTGLTDTVSESLSAGAILADLDHNSLSAGVSAREHDHDLATLDAAQHHNTRNVSPHLLPHNS